MMENRICNFIFLFIISLCTLCPHATAEIRLPSFIGNNMVLQRNSKISVWGWASTNAVIQVKFNGKSYKVIASKNDGKWTVNLSAMKAGGPYEMYLDGDGSTVIIKNILIGDVWICSGQSNMQLTFNDSRLSKLYAKDIENSENENIRQIAVAIAYKSFPANDCKTSGWKMATPQTLPSFSAVAYFFARNLYEKYHVPIGLINSSCGGTRAEAWTSEGGLKELPQYAGDIALLKDTFAVKEKISEQDVKISDWVRKAQTEDKGYVSGKAVWAATDFDDNQWKIIPKADMWDKYGYPNTFGSFWYRKEIIIPETAAGKDAVIKLGRLDDEDSTYFNGQRIGGVANRDIEREYKIPGTLVKAGKNVIAIRIVNYNGTGGMNPTVPLQFISGSIIVPIEGTWRLQQGILIANIKPNVYNPYNLPTALYNAMIAPIISYGIKGVIWYQGENNTDKAYEYQKLFPALIKDWRFKWQQGNFPFIYQQLVNYAMAVNQPSVSQWAELREAQLKTLSVTTNIGMSVGIDIGEAYIHPVNKKDIGYRLSLAARKIAYGEKELVASGPLYNSMKIKGNKIVLSFDIEKSKLVAKSGELKYFTIAGVDRKFAWANAVITGDNTIEVSSRDVANPVAVRYAWADNPDGCNLYNENGLPASPFRTDNWRGITQPKE